MAAEDVGFVPWHGRSEEKAGTEYFSFRGQRHIESLPSQRGRNIKPAFRSSPRFDFAGLLRKGACQSTPPEELLSLGRFRLGLDGHRLRLRLLGLPAAERLQVVLGELLRSDAIVLLDGGTQNGRQSLALDQQSPELLRRFLLDRDERRLLLGNFLEIAHYRHELETALLQMGELRDVRGD